MIRSLRHMAIICGNQVRRVLVDRGTAIWLIALPLALIGILGLSLQSLMSTDFTPENPYKVVVAETESGTHEALVGPLQRVDQYLDVTLVPTAEHARELVLQRDVDAAVLVSPEDPSAVTLISTPGSVITEIVTSIVHNALLHIEGMRAASVDVVHTEVQIDEPEVDGVPVWLQTDSFTYYAVGIIAMFVMFAAHAVGVTGVKDRATDAYARLRTLGVKPAVYMLAGSGASIVVSVLFISFMSGVSNLLFGITLGNLLLWAVVTLLGATAAAGLSLVVMALIPKPEHIDGAGAAIFNVLAFLGGSMTPLHVLPEWFRTALAWLPNRALLTGYLKIADGADAGAISSELMTLTIATAILFIVGSLIWTMREKGEA